MGRVDKKEVAWLRLRLRDEGRQRVIEEVSLNLGVRFGRDLPGLAPLKPVFFTKSRTCVGLRRSPVKVSMRATASLMVAGGWSVKAARIVSTWSHNAL